MRELKQEPLEIKLLSSSFYTGHKHIDSFENKQINQPKLK